MVRGLNITLGAIRSHWRVLDGGINLYFKIKSRGMARIGMFVIQRIHS